MTSSVDPRLEIAAIQTRLDGLTGLTKRGYPQEFEFPRDGFSKKLPYRDFEPGSVIPASGDRLLGAPEQSQPHIWAFQIHHFAPTRDGVNEMSIETDMSLIGWEPSTNASEIGLFYFNNYDELSKSGETIGYIATRFYQSVLGQSPDP
jgi:hypothetical protein